VLANLARDWPDIERIGQADIALMPGRFRGGRNSWIAQGYLRLRDELRGRGYRVTVSSRPVPDCISIAHRDDVNEVASEAWRSLLVVVRADRAPVVACDFAIVQNGVQPAPHERFIPLWPQPGLVPRDRSRPTRVGRIVLQGRNGTPPPWLGGAALESGLAARGVQLELREHGWHDYRNADVALTVRADAAVMLAVKPATKIYNAWLAGVPVLAGAEPAHLELQRSGLDFLVVRGPMDILRAVDLLNAVPSLYRAMVENGRMRGAEFDVEGVRDRWIDFIEADAVPAFRAVRAGLASRRAWFVGSMLRQKALSRHWKMRLAIGRSLARASWASASLRDIVDGVTLPRREAAPVLEHGLAPSTLTPHQS
jgi:hypothetical protein